MLPGLGTGPGKKVVGFQHWTGAGEGSRGQDCWASGVSRTYPFTFPWPLLPAHLPLFGCFFLTLDYILVTKSRERSLKCIGVMSQSPASALLSLGWNPA